MTIAEWVRQALAHARRREPIGDVGKNSRLSARPRSTNRLCLISTRCSPKLSGDIRSVSCDSHRFQHTNVSHRHSRPPQNRCPAISRTSVSQRQRLVTDTEVLQEILHGYVAINRRHDIQPAFDSLLRVVDEVLPMDRNAAERAKQMSLANIGCPPVTRSMLQSWSSTESDRS